MQNNNTATGRKRPKRGAVCAALTLFLVLGCLWICGNVFSFSRTESGSGTATRDLAAEYDLGAENFKSKALDGIYSIKLSYSIPETQIIPPRPDQDAFGVTRNKEDIAALAAQAEQYGLIDASEIRFLGDDVPWTSISEARYYLDKSIFTVTWRAEAPTYVANFTEVVISHPSQFRRYLTDNQFASSKRKTLSTMSKELNAVVGMNADFYAYRHIGVVVYEGKIYRDNFNVIDNCFVDDGGNLILARRKSLTAAEFPKYVEDNNIRFSLSFGPILVENGEVSKDSKGPYNLGEADAKFARAGIGQYGELHYLMCTVDGATTSAGKYRKGISVNELAHIMQKMGVETAYTLDGGQTASMTVNGEIINEIVHGSERPVSDIIYFATAIPDGSETGGAN